jgi:hypothetical protein
MKAKQWFAVNNRGITKVRRTKPPLDWDEIAFQIEIEVPDELFERPHIEAKLTITDVPNVAYKPELILNTKELIEQQSGCKVEMTLVEETKQEDNLNKSYGGISNL